MTDDTTRIGITGRYDPDMLIQEHVFQPLVDRTGIDPDAWKYGLHVFQCVTTIGAFLIFWGLTLPGNPEPDRVAVPIAITFMLLLSMVTSIGMSIRIPERTFSLEQMRILGWSRLLVVLSAVLCCALAVMAIASPVPSITVKILSGVFALGMSAGAAAVYVAFCDERSHR